MRLWLSTVASPALLGIGPREGEPPVSESADPIVRQDGIDELDELDCIEALSRLRQLLADPDEDVRAAARSAAENLEDLGSNHIHVSRPVNLEQRSPLCALFATWRRLDKINVLPGRNLGQRLRDGGGS